MHICIMKFYNLHSCWNWNKLIYNNNNNNLIHFTKKYLKGELFGYGAGKYLPNLERFPPLPSSLISRWKSSSSVKSVIGDSESIDLVEFIFLVGENVGVWPWGFGGQV